MNPDVFVVIASLRLKSNVFGWREATTKNLYGLAGYATKFIQIFFVPQSSQPVTVKDQLPLCISVSTILQAIIAHILKYLP